MTRVTRIIDRTMACLDGVSDDLRALPRFLELLIKTEVDAIEISEAMARLLTPLPQYRSYIVINNNDRAQAKRICGLDDAMCGDYRQTFSRLRNINGGDVEFCPGNDHNCATALAVEWLSYQNGGNAVTSFGGIDGGAATEEVIMALRVLGLRGADRTYEFLPEMTALFCEITKREIRHDKPIIGSRIFHAESGVHVDGIIKCPACYEPFPPQVVGLSRKIVLGKQSGAASIRAKLTEHNIIYNDDDVPRILCQVKAAAAEKNGEVSDAEFVNIAKGHRS